MAGRPRKYEHMLSKVLELLSSGMSIRQVAKETGIPKSTVDRMSKRDY